MKSGNGIPARCVYLEEMAADLEEQDWLDMDNVEQVWPASSWLWGWDWGLFPRRASWTLPVCQSPAWSCQLQPHWKQPRGFWGGRLEKGEKVLLVVPAPGGCVTLGWGRRGEQIHPAWGVGGQALPAGGQPSLVPPSKAV